MNTASLLLFQVANGLIWGLIVALLAVGLNLVYGLLNIVNVAQGALYMLGAYGVWLSLRFYDSYALGVIAGPLVVGALAALIERTIIRPVEDDHDLTIIITLGLAFIIEQAVHALFGSQVRPIKAPVEFTVPLFAVNYPGIRLIVAGVALLALLALWVFLHRTRFGLRIRAVRHNPSIAQAIGIPIQTVFAVTFGIGAALAALGGALASPIVSTRPEMATQIIVVVFVVVIVGGLGNIFGSALIAIILAVSEGVAAVFFSPTAARVISLLLMSAIILRWPRGLGHIAIRSS
jgi:branched-chain amino acid transport system permease protein